MKVCLFLEHYHSFGGALYRNVGTGIVSSYENQKAVLAGAGIPFVESWDDSCDILQVNTPGPGTLALMRRARRAGGKVVAWAHMTAEDLVGVFRFTRATFPLTRRYLARAYGLADRVFCPTEYTRGIVASYGIPESKLAVLSNGVDLTRFTPDTARRDDYRRRFDLDGTVVGTLALAIPRKGIDTFVALARQFPQTMFIWYGKIYPAALARGIPAKLPANVRFTGFVDDAVAALNSLDIFLFPSYEENQGMAILEAGASGLPLLVRDLPAYRGWLNHGANCLKAATNTDFGDLLAALLPDPSLRSRLAAGAAEMARSESIEEIGRRTAAYYRGLLA
ncbi:MAG: glycosyltransferase family 4 protein [Capsulimonadaceae bacterium]